MAADLVEVPARLEVVGEVKAGDWPEVSGVVVNRGQAVSIMTGAPLPPGADAVVMVEHSVVVDGSHPDAQSAQVARASHEGARLPSRDCGIDRRRIENRFHRPRPRRNDHALVRRPRRVFRRAAVREQTMFL